MATTHIVRENRTAHSRHTGGVLAFPVLLLVAMVIVATAYIAYVLWPRWPGSSAGADAPTIPLTVAGVSFNVPPAAIRVPVQRRPGAHERVDLAFLWPSLEPPDPNADPAARAAETSETLKNLQRLFVTIADAGDTLPPAERIATIYPRYTAAQATAGPGGLAVLRFGDDTPYKGEDLIYDAAKPGGFAARCTRDGPGPTPGTCLYERRIATADVTVRFLRDWLDDWTTVADKIDQLIEGIQPAS